MRRPIVQTRILTLVVMLAAWSAAHAATPPGAVNYQGVLRDASDVPLDGSFDMTFRFFDAAIGGDEILVDEHLIPRPASLYSLSRRRPGKLPPLFPVAVLPCGAGCVVEPCPDPLMTGKSVTILNDRRVSK